MVEGVKMPSSTLKNEDPDLVAVSFTTATALSKKSEHALTSI